MVLIQGAKAFVVLLCNFTDSPNPRPFTVTAVALNFVTNVAFWKNTSYGHVSLEDPSVKDCITLALTNSEFRTKSRGDMIQYAKDHSRMDQTRYIGFIVILSEPGGTAWTEGTGAIFEPSIVAHPR